MRLRLSFRYCLRELAKNPPRELQEVHTEAQQEWKKVLGDTGAQEMFLKIRENESPFVRYDEVGFELEEDVSTSSRSSFVQITPRQSDEINSDKASDEVVPSKRPRVKTACVPDAIDLLVNDTEEQKMSASRIFNQKLIERLCSKLCPELLSEDVLNNSSFVDSVTSYVRPLLTYLERYENYKLMHVRERKD